MSAEYFELAEEDYPAICYNNKYNDILICARCDDEVYYTAHFEGIKLEDDLFMNHKGCKKCGGLYFERISL